MKKTRLEERKNFKKPKLDKSKTSIVPLLLKSLERRERRDAQISCISLQSKERRRSTRSKSRTSSNTRIELTTSVISIKMRMRLNSLISCLPGFKLLKRSRRCKRRRKNRLRLRKVTNLKMLSSGQEVSEKRRSSLLSQSNMSDSFQATWQDSIQQRTSSKVTKSMVI